VYTPADLSNLAVPRVAEFVALCQGSPIDMGQPFAPRDRRR
jgi:hypothetical protein